MRFLIAKSTVTFVLLEPFPQNLTAKSTRLDVDRFVEYDVVAGHLELRKSDVTNTTTTLLSIAHNVLNPQSPRAVS